MRKFRWILAPFALLYGLVVFVRNTLYDFGILKSHAPGVKTIVLGNLSLGGSGKTPMVEYILHLLEGRKVAVLSRGYGRSTRGTQRVIPEESTAGEVGDEPLQIARKHPSVPVVCDGNRLRGIQFITDQFPETEVILLDDALQHRKLKGGFNVLLTPFDNPFPFDHLIPWGELRDHPMRARQADVFVVTKTPAEGEAQAKNRVARSLRDYNKPVLFSHIRYGKLHAIHGFGDNGPPAGSRVVLLSGIAKPGHLLAEVQNSFALVRHFSYPDHHRFTPKDIKSVRDFIGNFASPIMGVITTEKDAMRLMGTPEISREWSFPVYYWEIQTDFGLHKAEFDQLILDYVDQP